MPARRPDQQPGGKTGQTALARRRKSPSTIRCKELEKSHLRKKTSSHAFFGAGGDESPNSKGGGAVKDGGVEGHSFCTSEARAWKNREEAAPPPAGFILDGAGGRFPQNRKRLPRRRRPLEADRPTRQRAGRER